MKITEINFKDGINAKAHRKENNFQAEYLGIAVVDGAIKVAVNLRIYGTQAKNYCCLWYNNGDKWGSGSGSAGGYGYHRPSSAADSALLSAGVVLDESIDSRGDTAMREAVKLLVEQLYPNTLTEVLHSHP